MAFLPPAIFEIKAVADKAIAEFKQVNNELGKMEDQSLKAGGSIGGIDKASRVATAGLLAMGAAFAGFAALGIKEAMDAEIIMTKLNATLATQGLNTAKTRKEIDDLAKSFVQLGFDDEAASASMQILISATGDLTKSKGLLSMAADLARAKTMSLEEASGMLAKASMGAGKIFKLFGITLDETLPKSQATAKAMSELKEKLSGQAAKAAETLTVQFQILKEQFNNAAQTVGEVLIPHIKNLIENFNKAVEFVKRNSTAFQIFGSIVLVVTVALASYAVTLKVITAATKTYAFVQGVAKTATALLTGQQIALNGAMAINPIGLVVAAVVLLIGVFVILWNKSDTFRKGVIAMAKAALNAFASIIPMVGQVGEAILKFALTPLKMLLTVLSKLPGVGKFAKAGLDLLNKGLEGVSDFADKAAAKAKTLAAGLDKFNKPIKITFLETTVPDFGNAGGGVTTGLTPEQKEAQAKLKKDNEEYMKIVKDFQDKIASAQKKFDETMIKVNKDYQKKVTSANSKFNESMGKINEDYQEKTASAQSEFNETMAKIDKDYQEKTIELNKNAQDKITKLREDAAEKKLKVELDTNKKITEVQTRFNDEMGKLNAKKASDLENLTKDNQNKIAAITLAGNNKLQAIVEQSVNRLRNAFESGTKFSVTDLFKGLAESGAANAEGLLASLRTKLDGARQLAINAAMLQSQGFSQTFIEQVVGAGPEVGNQLANSLKNATPQTIQELQQTFLAMESTQNNGLDTLAVAMNTGARLATSELNAAYKDAEKDLAVLLADQTKQYTEAQVAINKTFNEAIMEAEVTRDSAIAALKIDLAETLAEIDKELQKSLVEVNKDLLEALNESYKNFKEAQANANKELTDTLTEAYKNFQKAQADARKTLADSLAEAFSELQEAEAEAKKQLADTLAEIEKDMIEKLASITNATKATIAAIQALASAMASAKALTIASVATAQPETGNLPFTPVAAGTSGYTLSDAMKKTGALSEAEYLRESGGGNINKPAYTLAAAMVKTGAISQAEYMRESGGKNITINQNIAYPTASADEISARALSAIKFGTISSAGIYSGTRVGR